MNIGEAIAATKGGKVVSADHWAAGVWVGWSDGRGTHGSEGVYLRTVDGLDVPYTPSAEDWFANWGFGDAKLRAMGDNGPPPYGPGFKRE